MSPMTWALVGKPIASTSDRSAPARANRVQISCRWWPAWPAIARGTFINVNADQMAVSVAAALKVDKLLFLTDVDGVRGQDNQVCSNIKFG